MKRETKNDRERPREHRAIRIAISSSVVALLFLISCGPGEERVKQLIAQELDRSMAVTFHAEGETIGPYSPAVSAGAFVFVSGQIGMDPAKGGFPSDAIGAQTEQALRNLDRILKNAGLDSSDVVQCTVYLTDMTAFPDMNLVYGGYFPEDRYPARTTVEVRALPRAAKVEIAAIAFRGKK